MITIVVKSDIRPLNGSATSAVRGARRGIIRRAAALSRIADYNVYPIMSANALVKEKSAQTITASNHWSSTENNTNNAWNVNFSSGNTNNNNKNNNNVVRAVAALSDEYLQGWIEAYIQCCSNKKTSPQCTFYRIRYEYDLFRLAAEVISGFMRSPNCTASSLIPFLNIATVASGSAVGPSTIAAAITSLSSVTPYHPSTSITFCVTRPKLREIFAANFRDRIVQHWIIRRIEPILEARFVSQGNVSYNCRKGFGTLLAVQTARRYSDAILTAPVPVASASGSSTPTSYIAKFDISSFFMSIDVDILWSLLEPFIRANYHAPDLELLIYLTRVTIYHRPQDDCERHGILDLWQYLPASKSLFGKHGHIGMPIGNITSQQFANFYMSFFDEWALSYCSPRGWQYMRFVDDFIIIGYTDGKTLSNFHREASAWMQDNLHLTLHPQKRYIQPLRHGFRFVGSIIMPHRTYLIGRTYDSLCQSLQTLDHTIRATVPVASASGISHIPISRILAIEHHIASINSLMGFCVHSNSYSRRRKMFARYLSPFTYRLCQWRKDYRILQLRKPYRFTTIINKYKL